MKQCGDHLEAIRKTSEEIVAAASKAFEDGVVPVVTNVMEWWSMQGVIQAGEAPDDAIVSQYLFAVDALNDAIVAAHSAAPTAGGGGAGSICLREACTEPQTASTLPHTGRWPRRRMAAFGRFQLTHNCSSCIESVTVLPSLAA